MSEEHVERRLAAVLAADIAGYSRLMGGDEEGTLSRLKALRKTLVYPKIAEHRGRIVKTTGDGMLIEFASAVDAARCAVEVQRNIVEQNTDVSHENRIEFRIGIHVGDIIIDDNDIFGAASPRRWRRLQDLLPAAIQIICAETHPGATKCATLVLACRT